MTTPIQMVLLMNKLSAQALTSGYRVDVSLSTRNDGTCDIMVSIFHKKDETNLFPMMSHRSYTYNSIIAEDVIDGLINNLSFTEFKVLKDKHNKMIDNESLNS